MVVFRDLLPMTMDMGDGSVLASSRPGKQIQGQSPGLLTRSWLLGEPEPWTIGSGETLELRGQGLTFSSWVLSVDPVLFWALPPGREV